MERKRVEDLKKVKSSNHLKIICEIVMNIF